jgi:hypothetical protein
MKNVTCLSFGAEFYVWRSATERLKEGNQFPKRITFMGEGIETNDFHAKTCCAA